MATVHAGDGAQPRYTHCRCSLIRLVSGVAGEGAYRLPVERRELEHRRQIQWCVRAVVAHVESSSRIGAEGRQARRATRRGALRPWHLRASADTEIDIHPLQGRVTRVVDGMRMPVPQRNPHWPAQHRGAAVNRKLSLATPNNKHLLIGVVKMVADSALGQNDAAVHEAQVIHRTRGQQRLVVQFARSQVGGLVDAKIRHVIAAYALLERVGSHKRKSQQTTGQNDLHQFSSYRFTGVSSGPCRTPYTPLRGWQAKAPAPQSDVGRTPPSAPDPLVRLFLCSCGPTRGSAAGQGARPTKLRRFEGGVIQKSTHYLIEPKARLRPGSPNGTWYGSRIPVNFSTRRRRAARSGCRPLRSKSTCRVGRSCIAINCAPSSRFADLSARSNPGPQAPLGPPSHFWFSETACVTRPSRSGTSGMTFGPRFRKKPIRAATIEGSRTVPFP